MDLSKTHANKIVPQADSFRRRYFPYSIFLQNRSFARNLIKKPFYGAVKFIERAGVAGFHGVYDTVFDMIL